MKTNMNLKSVSNSIAKGISPNPLYDACKGFVLSRQAKVLQKRCEYASNLECLADEVLTSPYFRPQQIKMEIVKLLELLEPAETPQSL